MLPHRGHRQLSKIARKLNIHTSLVSHIFQGPKHLSYEQACDLAEYYELSDLESEYLIALVMRDRAGTTLSRKRCQKNMDSLKKKAHSLSERVTKDVVLSDAESALFFSHWSYAAVKLLISSPKKNTPFEMAKYLKMPIDEINKVLEFLVSTKLCIYEEGAYKQGPMKMQLDSNSPFVTTHRTNWRIKAIEKLGQLETDDFCFSMPANLTYADAKKLRNFFLESIEHCVKIVDHSKPETMYCINIDWFKVIPN
jgi:uncharacterized protein (TIGR02147 family)